MVALRGLLGTVSELFRFLIARKLWWILPMVFLLLALSSLIILGSTAGIGPFIYTLF